MGFNKVAKFLTEQGKKTFSHSGLSNFVEKGAASESVTFAALLNGNEKIKENWASIITGLVAGGLAAIPVYGPAFSAVSLIVFKIATDNTDPMESTRKLIHEMVNTGIGDFSRNLSIGFLKGILALKKDIANAEGIGLAKADPKTMREKFENLYNSFLETESWFLTSGQEVTNLGVYAQFGFHHITSMFDYILRFNSFGGTETLLRLWKITYKEYQRIYIDKCYKYYLVGLEKIKAKYPELALNGNGDHNARFNALQKYRNYMLDNVFTYVHVIAKLDIDNIALLKAGSNIQNPIIKYSKFIGKTTLALADKLAIGGFIYKNPCTASYRIPADQLIEKLTAENGEFYFSDVFRFLMNVSPEKIFNFQTQYINGLTVKEGEYTKIYGNQKPTGATSVIFEGPLKDSIIVNTRNEVGTDRVKYIQPTTITTKYGASNYFSTTGEVIKMEGCKIAHIVGINQTTFQDSPSAPDDDFYGFVVAFTNNSAEAKVELTSDQTSIVTANQPHKFPIKTTLTRDYNKLVGLHAINVQTGGSVTYGFICPTETKFKFYINAETNATLTFGRAGQNPAPITGKGLLFIGEFLVSSIGPNSSDITLSVKTGPLTFTEFYVVPSSL
ncbi:hypothetical protein PPL_06262 [Heterostelium album PN500]|uniref:Pesticidal crystal protein domain-containing protein n=1 Tax=Heterostelium pallidum (strain ATCC 26659 / Pp 5 / PN500) TaxID=670386 RepID=D3BCN6_HETP5|nr:hypothetical protein PPL_06262 [Heterostelium album PN500]EFA80678.1 hypothetical protein PPL_06262 [Heterostelium album PN500]|eukprot:XP_020432798.1 hypothetical protein PPL_06262 [Heterostelium album PN500]